MEVEASSLNFSRLSGPGAEATSPSRISRATVTAIVRESSTGMSPSCQVIEFAVVAAGAGSLDLKDTMGGSVSVSALAAAATVPRLFTAAVNLTGAPTVTGMLARLDYTTSTAA